MNKNQKDIKPESEEPGNEVAVPQTQALATVTPAQLLQQAIDKDLDIDKLTKLMDLQERWEKNEARKAYVVGMAAFKAEPPKIIKNSRVSFTAKGGLTEYDHATLDMVVNAVAPGLSANGLSHVWRTSQSDDGKEITVTCILTHVMGHSESTRLVGQPDLSGSKNSIQGIGSTITYLQRYTLLAALGLATEGQDNDTVGLEEGVIDDIQIRDIEDLIKEANLDIVQFHERFNITRVGELPASKHQQAVRMLNDRINANKAAR